MRSNEFILGDKAPWESAGAGISRQILGHDEKILMVRIKFETGSIGQLHKHFHSQVTYVISGKFEAEVDGKKKILIEGDAFYISPNVLHGVVCLEAGEFIDVFSPTREDFFTT